MVGEGYYGEGIFEFLCEYWVELVRERGAEESEGLVEVGGIEFRYRGSGLRRFEVKRRMVRLRIWK